MATSFPVGLSAGSAKGRMRYGKVFLFLEQLAQTLQGLKQLLMLCVFLFHFL